MWGGGEAIAIEGRGPGGISRSVGLCVNACMLPAVLLAITVNSVLPSETRAIGLHAYYCPLCKTARRGSGLSDRMSNLNVMCGRCISVGRVTVQCSSLKHVLGDAICMSPVPNPTHPLPPFHCCSSLTTNWWGCCSCTCFSVYY